MNKAYFKNGKRETGDRVYSNSFMKFCSRGEERNEGSFTEVRLKKNFKAGEIMGCLYADGKSKLKI